MTDELSFDVNELFIGLVGPVGVDLETVNKVLSDHFNKFGYKTIPIRLSSLLHQIESYNYLKNLEGESEFDRIKKHMDAGTDIRTKTNHGDILALLAISNIKRCRNDNKSEPKRVYILNSLKHPEEINRLRNTYGKAFFAISVYAPRSDRVDSIANRIANTKNDTDTKKYNSEAEKLITIDYDEENNKLGQSVSGAFPLSDLFVDSRDNTALQKEIARFINAIFGYQYFSPTKDELGMYMAYASAMRSSDLSRQVGAVITTGDGSVLSLGCNDVPKYGGGLYWEGDAKDKRDFREGKDISVSYKKKMLTEVIAELQKSKCINNEDKTPDQILEHCLHEDTPGNLSDTQIMDVIEFGRSVHAEMSAISDATNRGVSVNNGIMYSTTFPCHICARHIVATGIKRVVYIQPYLKSQVDKLYDDSIKIDPDDEVKNKVIFEPFQGIAPSRFKDTFQHSNKRKKNNGDILDWDMSSAVPDFSIVVASYMIIEETIIGKVIKRLFQESGLSYKI